MELNVKTATAKLRYLAALLHAPLLWAGPIEIREGFDQNVNSQIQYRVDDSHALTAEAILKTNEGWLTPATENLTFGLPKTTVWIRVPLSNTARTPQAVFLEFNPIFLEKLEAFDATGKALERTGSTLPSSRLESAPTLKLQLPPGPSLHYVRIQSRSNALAVRARSEDKYRAKSDFDIAIFCILVGGLLSLMTYHIFLFFTYRHWTYLFYSLFIASTIQFTVSFCSFHKWLLPARLLGFPVDFWWSALSAPILLLFMYLFSSQLLGLFPSRPYFTKANRGRLLLLLLPMTELFCIAAVFLTNDPRVLIPIRFSALLHILILPSLGIALWLREKSNTITLYYALSWLPFAAGAVLIVAWLSGAVGHHILFSWSPPIGVLFQSVLLSFAAGQQLNVVTRDKLKEQKAKLLLMGELEAKVEILHRRDQVISTFASPEILKELDRGENPLTYQPRNVNKSIVFLDMHNYTTFFETYSPFDCQQIINEYFSIINDTTYAGGGAVDKIIGDAMMLEFSDPVACLRTIVQLRRNLIEANRKRFAENRKLLQFGLGVSYGNMLSANFGSSHKYNRTLVGDPVNVASRLETITRQFSVDILCSKEFIDLHHAYDFYRPAGYVLLKGRKKKSLVYEIFEHHPPAVVEWKRATRPAILEGIELELNGKYVEALALVQSLIDKCPAHRLKPGAVMDLTLVAMADAIKEKMRQLELPVPKPEALYATEEYKRAS